MTEYKSDYKLGVGEILLCSKDTKGKFESLKPFMGKVMVTIGGGADKIYIVEEKDRAWNEVKSIQSRYNLKKLFDGKFNSTMNSKNNPTEELKRTQEIAEIGVYSDNEENEDKKIINYDFNNENTKKIGNIFGSSGKDRDNQGTFSTKEKNLNTTNRNKNLEIIGENAQEDYIGMGNDANINPQLEVDENFANINSSNKFDFLGDKNQDYETLNSFKNFQKKQSNNPNDGNTLYSTNKGKGETLSGPKSSNNTGSKASFQDKENQIVQLYKGKNHLIKLTQDGKVYGCGDSYFGVCGLGGSQSASKPIEIPNLSNKKIIQIACGMFHSLALTKEGDLFSWGMGFEGQLGLTAQYKCVSSPRYVKFFFNRPVKFIACGHNYSLCITYDNKLWGWGENTLGQLGLGKQMIVDKPTLIELMDKPGGQENCMKPDTIINGVMNRPYSYNTFHACSVSAGFAHSAVVTNEGNLLTFGLNIYGQLGLGHTHSVFEPKLIEKDENGDFMKKIVKVCCNSSGTFMITDEGKLYTCGSGQIGHGELGVIQLPRLVNDSRVYSHIFSSDHSVVAFCPLRIISVSPNSGPASGNTILSIIGSALKDFPKLSVRFIFGGVARDVKATFDKISRTIFVKTPNFIELCPNIELPSYCKIQLTFDGHYFTEYEEQFFIYSTNMKISAIEPKCGPTLGGSQLILKMNLDNIPSKYLFSLTVGFQAKPVSNESINTKKIRNRKGIGQNISRDLEESKISMDEKSIMGMTSNNEKLAPTKYDPVVTTSINPMDVVNDNQLEKANWYCSFATYENTTMICNIPKIDNFSQNQVEYNVDISINGQQFSGYPMIYRFYEIKIDKMFPNVSSIEGGLVSKITGQGLFDSLTKKAKISSSLGERFSDMQWDRSEKALNLVSNPLFWITNDEDFIRKIPMIELYENYDFNVSITMNNIDWIEVGKYKYCDPKITKANNFPFPDNCSEENVINFYLFLETLFTCNTSCFR